VHGPHRIQGVYHGPPATHGAPAGRRSVGAVKVFGQQADQVMPNPSGGKMAAPERTAVEPITQVTDL
jgi:hypothetical protein